MSPMLVTANERFPLFTWSFLFGSEPLFRYGAIFFFFQSIQTQSTSMISPAGVKPSILPPLLSVQ